MEETEACDKGNRQACWHLGFLYEQNSQGFRKDYVKAKEFYLKACTKKFPPAYTSLGLLYAYGKGVKKDYLKAEELFMKACYGNSNKEISVDGCYFAGIMYRDTNQSFSKVKKMFERACHNDMPEACVELSMMYINGEDVNKDTIKANSLLKKACNKDIPVQCRNTGMTYYSNGYIKRNYAKAKILFDIACDNDDAKSCYYLGNMYSKGHGMEENTTKALDYYTKSL